MAKIKYEGSEQFKPISSWGYVGYTLLFAIPVVGLILLIVFALSSKNINRRNLARSYWCVVLVVVMIFVILCVLAYFNVGSVRKSLITTFPELREIFDSLEKEGTLSRPTETAKSARTARTTAAPASTKAPAATSAPASKNAASSSSSGVRKEVKEAIDSYEAFFNEYASFMKKYATSANSLSMLADYTNMLTKYASTMEKWNQLTDDYSMNDAELKYYTEATIRIEKVLLSVN